MASDLETKVVRILKVDRYSKYLGCLVELNGDHYEIVIGPTNDESIMVPDNLDKYFEPQTTDSDPPPRQDFPYIVDVPVQPEGTCIAKCGFCEYGRNDKAAAYTSASDIVKLLQAGIDIALWHKLVESADKSKLSLLKGGDISFNRFIDHVVFSIAGYFPRNKLKLSSIAASNADFFQAMMRIRQQSGDYVMPLQISVLSTDEAERHRIVNNGDGNIMLYSLDEINEFAAEWITFGEYRITASFTLAEDTTLDPSVISGKFDPHNIVIKLRRLHPRTGHGFNPISRERYSAIYHRLVGFGYRVIIGNPTYSEIKHDLKPRRHLRNG